MNLALPTYRQALALPLALSGAVTPDFIDVNGHMNIRHYLDAGAMGADMLCRRVGINDEYRSQRRRGVFTAEHHIRYFTEMHVGTEFSVHTVVVARSSKAGHLLSFILDRTQETLSCTVEIILVGVDLDSRRPAEFPDDVATAWDGLIAETADLPWALPLSGAMGIRG